MTPFKAGIIVFTLPHCEVQFEAILQRESSDQLGSSTAAHLH